MEVSVRQLAKALGYGHSRMAVLVKAGCPRDPEQARQWIAGNVPGAKLVQVQVRAERVHSVQQKSVATNGELGAPNVVTTDSSLDFEDIVTRLCRLERRLGAGIDEALGRGDFTAVVALRKEQVAVIRALFESGIKSIAIARAKAKVVPVESSRAFVRSILMPLAVDIRSLPSDAETPEERKVLEKIALKLSAKVRGYITEAGG